MLSDSNKAESVYPIQPTIRGTTDSVRLPSDEEGDCNQERPAALYESAGCLVTGTVDLHGVEHPVTADAQVGVAKNSSVQVAGSVPITVEE